MIKHQKNKKKLNLLRIIRETFSLKRKISKKPLTICIGFKHFEMKAHV